MVERSTDVQRSRETNQRPPSWLELKRMQSAQVEQLPEIEKLPPMPPVPVSDKQKQQERSALGKLVRLLFWWRNEGSKGTLAKPKHVKTSHKERKMKKSSPKEKQAKLKGKSPTRDKKKKKSQGKGTTSGTEPSPKLAQEGGVNVHDLAKKFTVGFSSGGSSPLVVEDVSGRVQKGSVASAVQRLEENIKEKQAIDLTDYEVTGEGEEHEEDIELGETDEEDEEMLDDNEEPKVSDLCIILWAFLS